jgi:hypothetical protein
MAEKKKRQQGLAGFMPWFSMGFYLFGVDYFTVLLIFKQSCCCHSSSLMFGCFSWVYSVIEF